MAAHALDLNFIDADGSRTCAVGHHDGVDGMGGTAVEAEDLVNVVHHAVLAELNCAARKFFLGRLEDKFHSAFGGEDYAYYLMEKPGAYFQVGMADPERPITSSPHHNCHFMLDERGLKIALEMELAVYLNTVGFQVEN